MYEIVSGVGIGDASECSREWLGPILHVARHPCFKNASAAAARGMPMEGMGDSIIVVQNGMYIDMVDAPTPALFTVSMFRYAIAWLDMHRGQGPLVHCNRGLSRAPAIVMTWMARRDQLSSASRRDMIVAQNEFRALYPRLVMGTGVSDFLLANWKTLMEDENASHE